MNGPYSNDPLRNGTVARALRLLGAYAFGGAIAFAAGAMSELATGTAGFGAADASAPGPLPRGLWRGACWIGVVTFGAWLLARMGRGRAVVLAWVSAFGGLSALFVPLLVYGFPARVYGELRFEALLLGAWLPVAVRVLSRRR